MARDRKSYPRLVRGAVLALVAACAGCSNKEQSPAAEQEEPPVSNEALSRIRGLELFANNGCVLCHCTNAMGNCNLGAPGIQSIAEAYLRVQLRPGAPHPLARPLNDVEFDELHGFLDGVDEFEPIFPPASSLDRGYNLYASRDGCINCHLSPPGSVSQPLLGPVLARCDSDDPVVCPTKAEPPTPDEIYLVLTGQTSPCHPVQVNPPSETPCECGDIEIQTTSSVALLTDVAPPARDRDREELAAFLAILGPAPSVADPCAIGEETGDCAFDEGYVHVHDGVMDTFEPPSAENNGIVSTCGDAGVAPIPDAG